MNIATLSTNPAFLDAVRVYHPEADVYPLKGGLLTIGTELRRLRRVIYIAPSRLITRELDSLYMTPLGYHGLAAYGDGHGFSTDLLLLDLVQWRNEGTEIDLREIATDLDRPATDQEIMNICFENDWLEIEGQYLNPQ